jgi:hypothetical protein
VSELLIFLEQPIGILASILILIGQYTYFIDVWKEKIEPSILTWYGWALLMGSLVVAQVISIGWDWSLTSLTSCTFGCVAIGTASLIKKNYLLLNRDWWFLGMGIFCFVLYFLTKDPWLTTIYAVLADLIIGIPTIIKAYKEPENEKSKAWVISLATWSLTVSISFNHDVIYAIFPLYVWVYSIYIVYLVYIKKKIILKQ